MAGRARRTLALGVLAAGGVVLAWLPGWVPAGVSDAVVSITSGPPDATSATIATFAWAINARGVAETRCRLDGGSEERCTSPKAYTGLSAGAHRFLVRAYNGSGAEVGSDSWSWQVVAGSTTTTTATTTTATTTTQATTTQATTTQPIATTAPEPKIPPPVPPLERAIVGTPGDDTLVGTPGPDVILGLGGNDTIHGRGGNDAIVGGPGDDTLYGDAGNDRIDAGPGRDSVHGGTGDDRLAVVDGAFDRVLDGGPGRDRLFEDTAEFRAGAQGVYTTAVETWFLVPLRPIVFTLGSAASEGLGGTIELMNANGGNVVALLSKTKKPKGTFDSSPAWSPDGTQVAFVRWHVGGEFPKSDLEVVNWDGTGLKAVTITPDLCEQSPSWSPDGSRLAFYVEPCPGNERVAQKALDPAAPVTYVSGQNDFEDTEWRADGAFIYAGTCTGAGGGVYRMDPWAANVPTGFTEPPGEKRTPTSGDTCAPSLSVSATQPFRLLWGAYSPPPPNKTDSQIFSKDDGAAPSVWGTNLTHKAPPASFHAGDPDWSSDGKHIVFTHSGIWKMNPDGTGKQALHLGGGADWR